jgi:hypothetical protein
MTSWFLRLPGEIRNRIYEYALGGETITIGYETYRTTCRDDKPDKVTPVFKYNCTVHNNCWKPSRICKCGEPSRVCKCEQQSTSQLKSFTLINSICRQLYLETAILPYKLNLIGFKSSNTMVNFLLFEQRLPRQQRRAITRLILLDDEPGANILACLPNLEQIYLGLKQSKKREGWYNVIRRGGKEPKLKYDATY